MLLYRPILRSGTVIGYLWATAERAGFRPRATAPADVRVRAYWMRWLAVAREHGLSPYEAMASWNPAYAFRHGVPATGPPSRLPDAAALRELAAGSGTRPGYPDRTGMVVRYYPVVRGSAPIGHLWAAVDDAAAGFRPVVPDDDPAVEAWRRRLAEAAGSGLTPLQALHALRDAPVDVAAGRVADPLGQGRLDGLG